VVLYLVLEAIEDQEVEHQHHLPLGDFYSLNLWNEKTCLIWYFMPMKEKSFFLGHYPYLQLKLLQYVLHQYHFHCKSTILHLKMVAQLQLLNYDLYLYYQLMPS